MLPAAVAPVSWPLHLRELDYVLSRLDPCTLAAAWSLEDSRAPGHVHTHQMLTQHSGAAMWPHLAQTSAGGAFEGSPPSVRRAPGLFWAPVLATLPEGATVDGVEALSPISFHISRAACVLLAQYVNLTNVAGVATHSRQPQGRHQTLFGEQYGHMPPVHV